VFGNRVLRRIFVPRRDEVTRGWRKLHNEELRDLYSSSSIIRMIKSEEGGMDEACSMNGGSRNANRQLVENRPLGRPKHRWVDNMKMDLTELEWWEGGYGLDWSASG
jgi:hypothetical protein